MDQIGAPTDEDRGSQEFSAVALGLPLIHLVERDAHARGKQKAMKELPVVGMQGRFDHVRQRAATGCCQRRNEGVLGPVIILFPVRSCGATHAYGGHYPMIESTWHRRCSVRL